MDTLEEKKAKFDAGICIGCGVCSDICPNDAIDVVNGVATLIKPESCEGCGICEEICEQNAIKV